MKAAVKSLSEMPVEHKKRVFDAWEQMVYGIAKGDATVSVFRVGTQEVRMSVGICIDCSSYKHAVNELTKAFINCSVKYTIDYVYACSKKYIYITAEA